MFDHLSDPEPPELGDGFRDRVVSLAHTRRRRTRRAAGGVMLMPLLLLGGIAIFVRHQANQLERIEVAGLAPAEQLPPVQSDPNGTATRSDGDDEPREVPPLATPLNILVVGVDRRPPDDEEVAGSRADTIAVVRIDPHRERVSTLALPRDLWVTPDGGRGGRINSFTEDGRLVEVVSSLLDIDINHYIEIDFVGFQSLIDLAGGVTVPFDTAVRDSRTGFAADAGCNNLSGADALAYVRSRRLESFDPATGRWTTDPRSDIGRIARQQDLMQRVYAQVLTKNFGTTDKARLLTNVVDDITVDTGLDLNGLRAIFNAAALIGTENFDTYDLTPALSDQMIDGNSVLVADPAGVRAGVDRLLGRADEESERLERPNGRRHAIDPAATAC